MHDPSDSKNPTRVGKWCIMDYGVYLDSEDGEYSEWFVAEPSAFCKVLLGWIIPQEIKINGEYISYPMEEKDNLLIDKSLYRITYLGNEDEFFLVHTSVKRIFYDTTLNKDCKINLPGEGLLIWHIDVGKIDGYTFEERMWRNAINSYSRKTIDLVEADNTDPMINGGDATDCWLQGGLNLLMHSYYLTSQKYVKVNNIEYFPTNKYSKFFVTFEDISSNNQVKAMNNLFTPSKGEKVTFWFKLDYSGKVKIQIYSLGGNLIKDISKDFTEGLNYISWDGSTDGNEKVSPGIYIVYINGGGIKN